MTMPSVVWCKHGCLMILGEGCEDHMKEFTLGEDDKALLKTMGIKADREDDWTVKMAEAVNRGERVFFNPRSGEKA